MTRSPTHIPDRRRTLRLLALAGLLGVIPGCSRAGRADRVVLYSSVDDALLRAVLEGVRARTGLDIAAAGDTEATKNTGLVVRLEAERASPRADVWWSSEPMGSVRLARSGVFEAYRSPAASGWAPEHADPAGVWTALAARWRVIAYRSEKIASPPTALRDLADPSLRGRIGMARPGFGTTRTHMATLVSAFGVERTGTWLRAARQNGLRLFDGNASVVRAIAMGEIDVGLTDSDDVFAAERNAWDVRAALETRDASDAGGLLPGVGPLLIPNTLALVKGGPNPEGGRRLIDALLAPEVEQEIAASESRNLPLGPGRAGASGVAMPEGAFMPDFGAVADAETAAMDLCRRELDGL